MLFLNNLANPSAIVPSVVATKCATFDNLSYTTNITFFPAVMGHFGHEQFLFYFPFIF